MTGTPEPSVRDTPTPPVPPDTSTGTRLPSTLVRHGFSVLVPLLLPVGKAFSLARSTYAACRRVLRRRTPHEERIARLQTTVRRLAGERAGPLCTGTKEWQSVSVPREHSYKRRARPVGLGLDAILELDTERRVIRVEPGVTMGRLVRHLVRRGWTLPVVPELEALTVGGLTMGFGIETSSHRHGLFADTVESYEVLLGTGEVVRASATEHTDLFHALPWSMGSLGFVVAVELRIVPAAAWVEVQYHPVAGLADMCRDITRLADRADGPAFVEGFVYGPDEGAVVTGEFTDRPTGRQNRVCRWNKPWFHAYARDCARAGGRVEYVPLRQYYHRHSRSLFWAGELLVPFGNHPLFRLPFGWLMCPSIEFLKLIDTDRRRRHTVAQEALVPARHLEGLVRHCHEVFEVDKLWICPARLTRREPPGLVGPGPDVTPGQGMLFMDVAVIHDVPGPVRRGEPWDHREATRRFEAWVGGHNGFQAPYVLSELTREEYRAMFDCRLYDRVRHAYGGEGVFVDAYEKITSGWAMAPGK
ncbi:FAD-binding oxidoreductase [Streptomyces sp. ISL-22]|uniref:FAD-binding oxidoreductase n=1 Tax=unclassified Streptomyces TaxID=2593676 RepID=UPI001BEBF2FF|nr:MULTISPECIES: FAD-binding oxidoreductase [unclassified Streptomyces]MBT2420336.1 FAD-binding oxidoreductase [Streptomyces sp. ISL-24]MBT2433050.1 FAD-binding oxidoreductase [Streptomyces sp. ISL-22]